MSDDMNPALEAGEVVQTEVIEAEAPEAAESTEGQVESQPAEVDAEAEAEEQKSKSQERRERHKAANARLRQAERDATQKAKEAEDRLNLFREAAKKIPPPKQSDFADYETYQAALSAHFVTQGFDRRQAEAMEAEARAHDQQVEATKTALRQAAAQNWAAQAQEAELRYPDFVKVARYDAPINEKMAELIEQSEVAADVAYFLGKNPSYAIQMQDLSPLEMARALGRVEQMVSAPQAKTVSTAPKPISPVSPKPVGSKNPDSMSAKEYRAWREAGNTP